MLGYFYALLTMILLCAFWAGFQLWLNKVDPENQTNKESSCSGCEKPCDKEVAL